MIFLLRAFLSIVILGSPLFSFAQKSLEVWNREDILNYFEMNDIRFEGEYIYSSKNQSILIGCSAPSEEEVNYNFYLREGVLFKALITTTRNSDFDLINHEVSTRGYDRIAELKDQLGNTYWKYKAGNVDLIVINKRADWPEVYYCP